MTDSKPSMKITKNQRKLIDTGLKIEETPPSPNDMAFNNAILCQVGLPRSKVAEREFMRRCGDAWINVQAGYLDEGDNTPVAQPVPYGVTPRLTMAWITTYAKRHKTREIPTGNSAYEFLSLIGKSYAGTTLKNLRTQINALAACRIQIGYQGRTFNGQPVEQFDAWINDNGIHGNYRWPGVMILSEGYFNELERSAVPLDNRALEALGGSSLALDIYFWLAHRLYRISGKPVRVYWKNLREQFGQEYTGKDSERSFKRKFKESLKQVLTVYPQARVELITGGLSLKQSPPPIAQKCIND
ncbi:replication protein RepA [Kushneria indalinina]|uniref:RepA protein n=1 Tax=Kushneria indalinina DSM 14324 TaxID=1122140 RepID=A0A3D9DRG1_9GAMM|nr:replication protein RepA [Kushneria indalinina]REC93308.1 RepA protein [Kushneria indalinina DSM 14324]